MSERYFVEAFFTRHEYFPIKTQYCLTQKEAELCADRLSKEDFYYSVIVSFYRSDDCQKGFINRGVGAAFDSENWVQK